MIIPLRPEKPGEANLIWLPHAGGSAAFFQEISKSLPSNVNVFAAEYPGRGRRIRHTLSDNVTELARELADNIYRCFSDKEFVLFGHSMGALVGLQACRVLQARRNQIIPRLLVVSACEPPHVERKRKVLHLLSDEELIDELIQMNGEVGDADILRTLIRINMTMIRSDLKAGETYRFWESEPIGCRISVYSGRFDEVVRGEVLAEWSKLTDKDTSFSEFDGGHFYMFEQSSNFLTTLVENIL